MHQLCVGKQYIEGKNIWPEAMEYNFFSGIHELRFFFHSPSAYEVEAIRKMQGQFGLFVMQDLIFLLYRFTDYKRRKVVLEGDCPFSIHRVGEEHRTLPQMPESDRERVLLNIVLVDSDTGVVLALRAVSLSPSFSAALCSAIIAQNSIPYPEDYEERIQAVYAAYPSVDDMMQHCIETCVGGE